MKKKVQRKGKTAPTEAKEFDPSQPLANQKHEAFVRKIVEGKDATAAYAAVYEVTGRTGTVNGSRLLTNADIAARIIFLQQQAATGKVMDLREMLEFLTSVKRTPVGQVGIDSELAQKYEVTADGMKVWMPGKRECVELCAKLQGMLSDKVKVEHSGQIEVKLSEEKRAELLLRRREALTGGVN